MPAHYVEPQLSRFTIERTDGVEQIRIPMKRNWFLLIFLSFWLCGWTVGGFAAMAMLATDFSWFILFWLGGWAFGWLFAAAMIGSQIAGAEIIRVIGRDLETSVGIGNLRWRRLYRGDHIRNLAASDPNPWGLPWRMPQMNLFGARQGAIKFSYGARTIFAASSLDEPEGRMIVEWLRPKLPASASEAA